MTDTKQATFSCIPCEKTFKLKSDLNRHLKSKKHLNREVNKSTFSCEPCNKTFKLKTDLSRHLEANTHLLKTTKQMYKCFECETQFPTFKMFNLHRTIGKAEGGSRIRNPCSFYCSSSKCFYKTHRIETYENHVNKCCKSENSPYDSLTYNRNIKTTFNDHAESEGYSNYYEYIKDKLEEIPKNASGFSDLYSFENRELYYINNDTNEYYCDGVKVSPKQLEEFMDTLYNEIQEYKRIYALNTL